MPPVSRGAFSAPFDSTGFAGTPATPFEARGTLRSGTTEGNMATVRGKPGRPRERQLSPLGERIQSRMRRLGIGVDQVAKTSGVSRRTVYSMMDGNTAEPKSSTLAKIAAALGTTRERLSAGLF